MENIYFDVGNLLVKNLLLNDLNHDIVSYIYMAAMCVVFFISVGLMASPFVLCFLYHKEVKNENAFVLFGSGFTMLLVIWELHLFRTDHDINQALIQSKDEIHMLATKHNVDDKFVFQIAQDIVFCEPVSFKYNLNTSNLNVDMKTEPASHQVASATIQCENKNYYGKSLDYNKTKENLKLVQKIQHSELFIMQN